MGVNANGTTAHIPTYGVAPLPRTYVDHVTNRVRGKSRSNSRGRGRASSRMGRDGPRTAAKEPDEGGEANGQWGENDQGGPTNMEARVDTLVKEVADLKDLMSYIVNTPNPGDVWKVAEAKQSSGRARCK